MKKFKIIQTNIFNINNFFSIFLYPLFRVMENKKYEDQRNIIMRTNKKGLLYFNKYLINYKFKILKYDSNLFMKKGKNKYLCPQGIKMEIIQNIKNNKYIIYNIYYENKLVTNIKLKEI